MNTCIFHSDLTSSKFLSALTDASRVFSSPSYKVLFCTVMTHGERGDRLYCSDGNTVDVEEVMKRFKEVRGKPKVRFLLWFGTFVGNKI